MTTELQEMPDGLVVPSGVNTGLQKRPVRVTGRLEANTGVERTGCADSIRFNLNRQPGGQRDVKSNG